MSFFPKNRSIDIHTAFPGLKELTGDLPSLTTEFQRKFAEFFADRKLSSQQRYWISQETYTRLLEQPKFDTVLATDAKLRVHSYTALLMLGCFAEIITHDGKRFPLFVSKVMQMYPEGTIFVETLDLEQTIHNNRKDLHQLW